MEWRLDSEFEDVNHVRVLVDEQNDENKSV